MQSNEQIELVRPSVVLKESFLEAVKEFQAEGKHIYLHTETDLAGLEEGFEEFLSKIKAREDAINLPEDRVPQTELWLTDGNKFIGWTKIRHYLNENLLNQGGHIGYAIRPSERNKGYGTKILALMLQVAKDMGINRVLLTCDDDNVGSAKIIEKNGGILENKIEHERVLKRRYWIEVK